MISVTKHFMVPGGRVFVLLALLAAMGCGVGHGTPDTEKVSKRMVTDLAGRSVAIPVHIKRIACMTGASYEKAFLVGAGDKVVVRAATHPPWMERTNPRIQQIQMIRNSHDPNMEELLKQKVDVLFFWDDPVHLEKLAANGMAAVVPQPARTDFASATDFTETMKAEVRLYGSVLGGESEKRANTWCSYYERKLRYVLERTVHIPEARRPKVYYVRGPDALTTHGYDQNITWYGEMAGARMVIKKARTKNIAQISMEEIMTWNPDVIFVGRQYSTDLVLRDVKWKDIAAVRNKRVYVIPDGVFYWDSSSEGILLLEYMAKKLYPELFKELDMNKEVKAYYANFYQCKLTDDEIDKLLRGLGPDGQRNNPFHN
jgi:iron complex transport system substrate-binding protein